MARRGLDAVFRPGWKAAALKTCAEKKDSVLVGNPGCGLFERSWNLRGFENADDKITFWGCLGSQSTIPFGTPDPARRKDEERRCRSRNLQSKI